MKSFSIKTSSGEEKNIDIRTAISNYVEFSTVPANKKDESGKAVALTSAEKGHFKKCLEEAEDSLKQICKQLEKDTVESYSEFLNTFADVYSDDKENRKIIKKALVEVTPFKLMREWRCEAINELYETILRVEKTIPLGNNGYLTLNPVSAIYGWSEGNEKEGKKYYLPLPNEAIINTLKVMIDHEDKQYIKSWVIEILAYDKAKFAIDTDLDKYDADRLVLLKNFSLMMKNDEKLRSILSKELLDGNLLFELANLSKKGERVNELECEKVEIEKSYWERAKAQKEIIDKKDKDISYLKEELRNFEKLKDQYSRASAELTRAKEDLVAQREINLDIKKSDLHQLKEKDDTIEGLNRDLMLTKSELEELKESYEAITVDITLKNNEISRLKDSVGSKDSDATEKLLKGLASGLNNSMYDLEMFYQILSEDGGTLDEMNIEMFKEVLLGVDMTLTDIGLTKMGILGEVVEYDSAIHNPVNEAFSNGDRVKVSGFGWKINGEVFIKIPVEKEV